MFVKMQGPSLFFTPNHSTQITLRQARPDDAEGIVALYSAAYRPKQGGNPRDNYPFPQFLSEEWVANAVTRENICWMVSELNAQLLGSVGAIRNIGNDSDRVAEIFGLVVSVESRKKGLGRALLIHLCSELETNAEFIICESRTAITGGWKVAKSSNLVPLGFEPFAHSTPAGSESMLMTGMVSSSALSNRILDKEVSPSAYKLASSVLGSFKIDAPKIHFSNQVYPVDQASLKLLGNQLGPCALKYLPYDFNQEDLENEIYVERDDRIGMKIFMKLDDNSMHKSGVIGLKHIEGEDLMGHRYVRSYYVAKLKQKVLGGIYVVHDRIDQRARILGLQSYTDGLQGLLISNIVNEMRKSIGDKRLVLVVDILASATKLQDTLHQLDFIPTVYFPGIISAGHKRTDGIQYTRLFNCNFESSTSNVRQIEWPVAINTITTVKSGFNAKETMYEDLNLS